jgi:hypothetical protein
MAAVAAPASSFWLFVRLICYSLDKASAAAVARHRRIPAEPQTNSQIFFGFRPIAVFVPSLSKSADHGALADGNEETEPWVDSSMFMGGRA